MHHKPRPTLPDAAPTDTISSALRDRLDAARERLHVECEFIPAGDPRCHGRVFPAGSGFWEIRIGPDGWQHQAPIPDTVMIYDRPRLTAGRIPHEIHHGISTLEHTLTSALDAADTRWPEC